ncbi:MAG: PD40 domain-containing protein [Anaerolineaceae bacterium]|nr:PD40 domain-containing protein [Anaerolineaceae bacterium]
MDLSSETTLRGRYKIIRQLGKGGMGAVYLAYDTSLETEVAVKCNLNPSKESSTQFLREARLLAALRHPNLPRVIDHFLLDQSQYLVMDYIPGDDLGALLQRDGAQPIDKVLKWADEICSALVYLHTQKPSVIHRDIKPGNLKLMSDGTVMLVDFGIAKAADVSQATATGAIGYTPGYAPPEQYGGARTGPYSDQYSLAATLYMLLTNQKPADSVQRLLNQVVLTPLNLLNPKVPPYVQWAIEKAMSVRIEDRFEHVADFQKALKDHRYYQAAMHAEPSRPTANAGPATRTSPAAGYPTSQPPSHSASPYLNYSQYTSPAQPPPQVTMQGHSPTPSQPLAPPKKRSLGMFAVLAGGGGILLLGVGAIVVFTLLWTSGTLGGKQSPTQQLPPVVLTTAPTETPQPIATETPLPAATITPALPPTETLQPQPALRPLSGDKVLAYASDRFDGKILQIWTVKLFLNESGKPVAEEFKQITFNGADKTQPAWSPDGKRLLYVSDGGTGTGKDIFLLDLSQEGSQPVNLTRQKGDDFDPAWSPDGKFIAFTNRGKFTDVHTLYFMAPDGGNITRLSLDFEEYSPTWSPKTDWLMNVIYARDHRYLFMHSWVGNIYPTPFPTPQQYDPTTFFGRLGEVADPAWSPDGTHIAYTQVKGKSKQIYSLDYKSRGADSTLLTADSSTESSPAWSPDSQWIAFNSERDGNEEVYIMTAAGLLQTNLTGEPGRDLDPAWQP